MLYPNEIRCGTVSQSTRQVMKKCQHLIILPYFCEEEIARYLKIAQQIKSFPKPGCDLHFLLASSPKTQPSGQLFQHFSEIAPCTSFRCPTQVFGYPAGPTAMYWDVMEFIAENFSQCDGFALWLESDMAPVKPDWLDRLSAEWYAGQRPLMMGCYVPDVYKHRLFRKPKLLLNAHINGGACYATDFARRLPPEARSGVFDMAVFQYAEAKHRIRPTRQIAFSTLERVRRDVLDPAKVLLHGFMQEKDAFIDKCLAPVTHWEQKLAYWNGVYDRVENLQRRIRVQFVRRGHRAMLENMMLTKNRMEHGQGGDNQTRAA